MPKALSNPLFKFINIRHIVSKIKGAKPRAYQDFTMFARDMNLYVSADDLRAFKKAYMSEHKKFVAHIDKSIKQLSKK